MAKKLPARPNLDHLRGQAKTLLAQLKDGDAAAVRLFIDHLPEAKTLSPANVRAAGYRLADAQSVIARQTGFGSWPLLARHVQQLRDLEGDWRFASLQIDGADMPAAAIGNSRLLMDGDRFRMESAEANYDGTFIIDVTEEPAHIDIEFVEGPEAGNTCYGIFEFDSDRLTLCLGLAGSSRPKGFVTTPGSGHALERLRRASASRPAGVTGGTPAKMPAATKAVAETTVDPATFNVPLTPIYAKLGGEWSAVELVRDGIDTKAEWLPFGSRMTTGNEVKVVFGGQAMVHAKMKIDERASPVAVDYLNLSGAHKGKISLGIMEWVGTDVRFVVAVPGEPRPADFSSGREKGRTLSQWRRAK